MNGSPIKNLDLSKEKMDTGKIGEKALESKMNCNPINEVEIVR